ncbi:MAG TPA: YcxB family protein [Deltaproteobacteria bacterium]|nr:YcxB family protein [Deltaproteobacteria bacterium]
MTDPTPDPIELSWVPTEADQVAAWRHLHGSGLPLGAGVLTTGLCFLLLPGGSSLAGGSLAVGIGLLVGMILIRRLPHLRIQRQRLEGLLVEDGVRVSLDPDGIEARLGGRRSQVPWSGIGRIVARSQHVFIHLSDVQALAIPRRILGDGASQASFIAQVQTWRERGRGVSPPPEPEPGRDQQVLRFRLVEDDYVLFSRAIQATRLDRSAPGWALMGLLVGGTLVASAEPWRGPVDEGLLALMIAFSGLLTAMGLAPLWVPRLLTPWLVRHRLQRHPGRLPSGEIVLGVGPIGGWLGTQLGVSRFGWGEVRRVHSDADQVLVMFSEQLAVIVPARAFQPASAQDDLVEQIQRWRGQGLVQPGERGVGPGGVTLPGVRSPPPEQVPDPFAPPETGRSLHGDRRWWRSG